MGVPNYGLHSGKVFQIVESLQNLKSIGISSGYIYNSLVNRAWFELLDLQGFSGWFGKKKFMGKLMHACQTAS